MEIRTIAAYAILALLVLSLTAVYLHLTRQRRSDNRSFNREKKRRMAKRAAQADAAVGRT